MKVDLTAEENKALIETLECDIGLSAGDMGSELKDQIKQAEWIHTLASILQKLKKGADR